MQATLCCGRALPGGQQGQHNTTRATTRTTHGNTNSSHTTNTPQDLLPRPIRQAYLMENERLLTIRTTNIEKQKTETFGDSMKTKHCDSIRLVGQNIGCLGVRAFNNHKQDMGKEWLIKNNIDICCWQELGIALHMTKHQDRIHERMRDHRWGRIRISATNNRHESIDKMQFGGTMAMAMNSTAARVHASGADETGLGRWAWLLFEGHNSYRTRVISAYIPCKQQGKKDATVYAQHQRYYNSKGKNGCPRRNMIIELTDQIEKWQRKSENIVLFIDCNENLNKRGEVQRLLTDEKCNLIDPIRRRHNNKTPPPTYHRNSTYPIDSVFVSHKLRHIEAGGWLRFGEGIGDHRAIYFDIPMNLLLGENKFNIVAPQIRRLKCDDPRVVKKYNTLLEKQYNEHNTLQRIETLNSTFHTPMLQEEIIELEKLDRIATDAVLYAEKHCRRLCMGMVPFSDKRQKAGEKIELWKLVIRKKLGCNVSSRIISKLANKNDISKPMKLSMEQCIKHRSEAYKEYNKVKKDADKHRIKFQDKLHDKYESEGNDEMCNAIRAMKLKEETRHTHRRIKRVTKPFGGSVHRLSIEDSNSATGRRTTTDQTEIEQSLMKEYEQKYRLVYSTPFLQYPLRDEMGDQGLTESAEEVLLGTYKAPIETTAATKIFLQHAKMSETIIDNGANDDAITVKQCNEFWSTMKEKIQSSKSNKHVGTYKAATKNKTNSIIQARLMSIPYQTGYSLERWKESLNVSLLKKQEKYTPEDLRTIWYMEADCNGGSKIHFARRMMHRALDNKLLSESQYAQKGKQAIDAGLVKVLFLDHLRITKQAGSFTMNDLMQCFDRMSHGSVALASRRLGAGPRVIQSMLHTIQNMKHFIRTAYGDSRDFYGQDKINPLQGGGQGNGASMPFFVALTAIIIPILEESVDGLRIFTSISLTLIAYIVIVYVDDSDFLIAARYPNEPSSSIVKRTQRASSVWRDQVHQTGGAIRPHKCRWALIDFKWKSGIARYKKNNEVEGELYIKDTDGIRRKIARLEPYESEEGLGLQIPADGTQTNQLNNINRKTNKWIKGIESNSLTRREVYISLMNSVTKTITYSFTATSLNDKELHKISTPVYKTALPRMGIIPTLPLPFRYASSKFQGIDLPYLPTEQLAKKIDALLFHGNQDTQVGKSMTMCLEDIQLETGLIKNIFEYDFTKYGFLTQISWFRQLWESCHKHKIELRGPYATPKLVRTNDFCLMEAICNTRVYTKQQLCIINRCRIFLQAITMADITDSSGNTVTEEAYEGKIDPNRVSGMVWPNQQRPPPKAWELWKEAITTIWCQTGSRRLREPLGVWTKASHQDFKWEYDKMNHVLYFTDQYGSYKYIPSQTRTRRQRIFRRVRSVNKIPDGCEYATVTYYRNNEVLFDGSEPIQQQNTQNEFPTFEEYIGSLKPGPKAILKHSIFFNNGTQIADAIKNGDALAVTDASYEISTNTGAAAWTIVGRSDEIYCEGRIGQPATRTETDPYRAETLGLLAIMTAVEHLCVYHRIQKGHITVACDNDASLENGIDRNSRMKTYNKYFDLFWAISEIKARIPITVRPKKVNGHQDNKKSWKQLTRTEKLNCYVDHESKSFRRWVEANSRYEFPCSLGDKNWSLWIENEKVVKDVKGHLIDHIQGRNTKHHISKTNNITSETVDEIDWIMIERASKKMTIPRRLWLLKHVSGFAPTASKMHHRDEWDDDLCPQCNLCRETTNHIHECSNAEAKTERMKGIIKIKNWMRINDTAPDIVECISLTLIAGSSSTFNEMRREAGADEILHHKIHNAALSQDRIGWHNFCKGRVSKEWRIAQEYYLTSTPNKKRRSSKTWSTNLILNMYEFTNAQWVHRNSVVTNATKEKASISERKKLEKDIRNQYELGCGTLRPNDHYLLASNVEDILAKNTKAQKYWIRKCSVSRKYTDESEKNMLRGMRSIMNNWAMMPD